MLQYIVNDHHLDLATCQQRELVALLDSIRETRKPGYYAIVIAVTRMALRHLKRNRMLEVLPRTKRVDREASVSAQVIPDPDVERLIREAPSKQDRLLIQLLYETGARRGEIANLRIKDAQFDQYGAILQLTGKTGTRRRRVYASVPELREHLNNHPRKNQPDATLLLTRTGKPLKWSEIYRRVRELGLLILKHPIHPHQLRHTRATLDSRQFTDRELMTLFGWKRPEMVSVYTHLSMRDVEDKDLIIHGLKTREEVLRPLIHAQRCRKCLEQNAPIAVYCVKCGALLQAEENEELKRLREKYEQLEEQIRALRGELTPAKVDPA